MSDEYRFGDETPPAERSERLYQEPPGGPWYFRTREGASMGPFDTEAEAGQALRDFIEFIRLADLQTLSELTRALAPADDEGTAFEAAAGEAAAREAAAGQAAAGAAADDNAAAGNQPRSGDRSDSGRFWLIGVGGAVHWEQTNANDLVLYSRNTPAHEV